MAKIREWVAGMSEGMQNTHVPAAAPIVRKVGQSAKEFLRGKRGLFVFLHVRCEGKQTSVIVNIENRIAATWRWINRKTKGTTAFNLNWPGFELTSDTIVISDADLNALAAAQPDILSICTGNNSGSEFLLVKDAMSVAGVDDLLCRLEENSETIRASLPA